MTLRRTRQSRLRRSSTRSMAKISRSAASYNIDALGGLIDKLIKDAKPQEPAPDENAGAETTAECTEHVDANKDCVCDTCGAAIAHVDCGW